jgi:hypothetical protein
LDHKLSWLLCANPHRDISDHSPYLISISTDIPKAKIFKFENYWLLHDEFMPTLEHGWSLPCYQEDKEKKLGAKFKMLRKVLRQWHAQISNMATTIQNNKMIVSFLDTLEEFRDLALEEWNFRKIVLDHLENLLEQQTKYWKQRGKIK